MDGEAVKKSLAYVMTAVLLGATIMILPWTFRDASTGFFTLSGGSEYRDTELYGTAAGGLMGSLSFVGLMLAVSLVLALGVYLFSKRQI